MTIQELGALGEFLSSIAVFISLIYLALQVRKSTDTERTSTYQSVVADFAGLSQTIASTAGMSQLFVQGMENFNSIEEDDKARFVQLLFSMFHYFENIHYQYQKGYLDEDVWLGWKRLMLTYFGRPGVQDWWKVRRAVYSESFAIFLESAEIEEPLLSYYEVTQMRNSEKD
jgi:hypothetical protein